MGKNELDEIEKILKIVLKANSDNISSGDISDVINQLHELKRQVVRKEEVERKRQEEERRRQEEQQRLKEEKRLAEEHVKEITSMDLPMGWNNLFLDDERSRGIHVDSIADGLILSLRNLGCVDIEYISAITGEDYKAVISALKGSIYQNPNSWGECFFKGWETAEEYLSGNLMYKWRAAKVANTEYDGYFSDNIRALEKVMPPTVAREDVYITLGSPWVPSDIIDDFITHLFGSVPFAFAEGRFLEKEDLRVKHDLETGSWEIPGKGRYNHSVGVKNTYGTERLEALYILEKTLNMKSVAVYDEIKDYTKESGKRKVINQQETIAALEKQKKLVDKFQEWVWLDRVRKERLMVIFEAQYSCARKRTFDGAFLEFSTMSPKIALYPYQKNAVARILFSPNTLLAHDVGSGKTYVMIAAGMELRRMRLSKKHLYVVPNNLIGQWKNIFLNMYPQAKLLTVEPRDFKPEKRDSVLEKIRDEDFDGIIMAYSCFEKIPISREYYKTEMEEKKKRLMAIVKEPSCATSKLKRKTDSITESISNLILSIEDAYDGIYFDELGINQLFVDEAHNFKNVPIDTQIDKVLGINKTGSKKCQDMMDKVHVVQRQNGGGGVVMATGTPITNSITDIFVFQKYLQDGELAMMDLQHFDSWVGMFAEKATGFEVDVDTSNFRIATRFSKFHNLPELTTMISNFADFHSVDKNAGIPDFDGYADAVISKTPEFADYLKDISDRTEAVRNGDVNRKDDNMLKITTDGRKAALDYRLVNPKATFSYQSKVARCVENVANIYRMTGAYKSSQLIFCDTSTPKSEFNLYDEIKRLLQIYGIPEETIAFVHSAETEKRERNYSLKSEVVKFVFY